jgi:hypothetical protein
MKNIDIQLAEFSIGMVAQGNCNKIACLVKEYSST